MGTTRLEKADAPMEVVFGLIRFYNTDPPFGFIKDYCEKNQIVINKVDENEGFIDTQVIPNLKVVNKNGIEIKSEAGNAITGTASEGYEITVLGIPYTFYEEEFPHHVEDYKNQFE